MERRLSAILAADVVGYSALMEKDEAGAFERLKARRQEIFEPQIEAHRGRVFKLMGDGLLAEFASVVDAVEAAVAVQGEMAARNAEVPADQQIVVRIGVNVGDLIIDGEDRQGDGVNVASRLQQLAEPGGVMISGAAHEQLHGKVDLQFEFAGEQQVKNIKRPVSAYRLKRDAAIEPKTAPSRPPTWRWARRAAAIIVTFGLVGGGAWWLWPPPSAGAKPSVAVLPFSNYGGDEKTLRLSDGLTEDIITDLARFVDFRVVARNSSDVYKGKPVDVREVAKALDVTYVLEGSIQRQSGRVRISAQLINAATGSHLWSDQWDRPDEDVFAVQTEIANQVASQLGGVSGLIVQAELTAARRKRPGNLNAYEYFLLGDEKLEKANPASLEEAVVLYNRAVELDPGLARAWASLFFAHNTLYYSGVDPDRNRKQADEAAARAIEVDPGDIDARLARAWSLGENNDFGHAKEEFEAALRLAPGSAVVLTKYASWAASFGEPERGGELADHAIRLDPNYPMWAAKMYSYAYFAADRYEDALRVLGRATSDSYTPDIWIVRPAALAVLGRLDEAKDWVKEALKRNPDLTIEGWASLPSYRDEERQRFIKTMRLAGFPACAKPEALAKFVHPVRLPECTGVSDAPK